MIYFVIFVLTQLHGYLPESVQQCDSTDNSEDKFHKKK